MTQLLILFVVLSILNVILNTIKSIVTVKGGAWSAALINGITFFVYTYVIIYTNCELNMHLKAIITAVINIIGVYIVKKIEEKARKDKLWLVKMTIPHKNAEEVKNALEQTEIPFSYVDIQKYVVFDTYCYTQKDTAKVEEICKANKGKMFATENRLG